MNRISSFIKQAFIVPCFRIIFVNARVSIPEIPGIPFNFKIHQVSSVDASYLDTLPIHKQLLPYMLV